MNYRKLGATGLSVSEIGLGCEGFNTPDGKATFSIMECAEKNGVNCIDLYSPSPVVRDSLGKAIEGRREKFILQAHICTVWKNGQYERTRKMPEVKAGFEDLLVRLKTDYIDIGMIHYVDSVSDWENVRDGEIMKYALALKKEGKIRHIGLSSHNPAAALKAVESGLIEVIMFSVNPCYDLLPASENVDELFEASTYARNFFGMDKEREKLYETCQRKGVGITVMKVFGGGELLSDSSPAGKALTAVQCIHYALTRPAVGSVLVGAHSKEELSSSLAYETASDEEKDFATAFAGFPRVSWAGHCMYCGHCAPCSRNIDIAMVTKLLNLASAQKSLPETVREHYAALAFKGGDCVKCGKCETRCPFGVRITDNMRKAKELFGS